MTTQQGSKQASSKNNLLTAQEQAVCTQVANSPTTHSQRALALLALNEGNTQGQAATKTGLTTGQVKYWAAKFRKERLGIFPDALLGELNTKADTEIVPDNVAVSKASAKEVKSAKTKSKGTKAEKEKKSKKKGKKSEMKTDKKKKGKKDKKDKKDKKTEKKNQGSKKGNKSK